MAEQIGTELVANMSLPVEGIALSAFDGLDSTPGQRYFKEALRDIKKIADPMERIRRAYALSTAAQGRYDSGGGFDSAVRGLLIRDLTPSNMLEGRRRTGSAGVCRHFAALLNYALLQVSRHENSRSQELGPNDFSARILVGTVPVNNGWADAERHAWVRVHLPQFEGQRLSGFTRFDLDPTRNPESFVPLFPRRSGLTETNRRRLLRQCEEIRRCLELPSGTSHQGFGTDIRGRP